jgi:hypothetical protein
VLLQAHVHHAVDGLHLALGAEGAHALHFLGVNRVVHLVMRHVEVAGDALLLGDRDSRAAPRRRVHQRKHARLLLEHDERGGYPLLVPVDERTRAPGDERQLVDGIGHRDDRKRIGLEYVEHRHGYVLSLVW